MYAVIKTGGKQYRVNEGQTLKIEKIEAEEGDSVDFSEVLMAANGDKIMVGSPYISGAKVRATVTSQGRHPKVEIIKFRRRKHHLKHLGHRQSYTEIHVTGIDLLTLDK